MTGKLPIMQSTAARKAAEAKARLIAKQAAVAKAHTKQHQRIIECCHCGATKQDEHDNPGCFETSAEQDWYSCIDATGTGCKRCYQPYCNPCAKPNFFNISNKLMFCDPVCYLKKRGVAFQIATNSKTHMMMEKWCYDHLSSTDYIHICREMNAIMLNN